MANRLIIAIAGIFAPNLSFGKSVADFKGVKLQISSPANQAVLRIGTLHQCDFSVVLGAREMLPGPLTDWRCCYGIVGSDTRASHKCYPFQNFGQAMPEPLLVAFTLQDEIRNKSIAQVVEDERSSALHAMETCGGLNGIRDLPNATLYFQLEHLSDGSNWVPEREVHSTLQVRIYDEDLCEKRSTPSPHKTLERNSGLSDPIRSETELSGPRQPQSRDRQAERIVEALGGQRTLWSLDYHIGTLADLVSTVAPWGVRVVGKSMTVRSEIHEFLDSRLRGFEEVSDVKVLTRENGLTLEDCPVDLRREFFDAYHNDSVMENVDAFVCQFASAMCELYLPFDRPMLVLLSTRFDNGRDHPARLPEWVDNLRRIAADPRNVVAANNAYDAAYVRHFTGIENVLLLPSLCDTGASYAPARPQVLVGPGPRSYEDPAGLAAQEALLAELGAAVRGAGSELTFAPVRALYPHFEYSDLAAHPALVLLPYQVSITSVIEYYRMNIPLFAPSLELLVQWQLQHSLLAERSFQGARAKWSGTLIPPRSSLVAPHPNATHPELDPNNDVDPVALAHWLQLSDFYQWPHVSTFDSWEEFVARLDTITLTELGDISARMRAHNEHTLLQALEGWEAIFRRMFQGTQPVARAPRPLAPFNEFETSLAARYATGVANDECWGPPSPLIPAKRSEDPVCFPRVQQWDPRFPTLARRKGQVTDATSFGAMLFGLARRPDITRIVDIGTFYGGGSTKVFADALESKEAKCVDVNASHTCCDALVVSFEAFGPAHDYAAQYHRGSPVWLMHGTTVGVEAMLRPDEIPEDEKSYHFEWYYERDRKLMEGSTPQLERICRELGSVDLVLIDGNEYTGFAEFEVAHRVCRPRFLALHDISTLKTRKVEAHILAHPESFQPFASGSDVDKDGSCQWAIFKTVYPDSTPVAEGTSR